MYLLDANVWIFYLRSKERGKLALRFLSADRSKISTCSVVRAELLTGAQKAKNSIQAVVEVEMVLAPFPSFPFTDDAADIYAKVRADLESKGSTIGANDYLIAAIALANDCTVVTHNTKEFSRIAGLRMEDWQ
jgi:tRNA(fMet)-specific endonuclease VapC